MRTVLYKIMIYNIKKRVNVKMRANRTGVYRL